MNIFESLREDHDLQRRLMDQIVETSGDSAERRELFARLKGELAAHAAAEEKHFYAHLMQVDLTIDKARHSVAEHKELDDRVEELEATDMSDAQWLIRFKELQHRVDHHLVEEEREVFQMAGKALAEEQKDALGRAYRDDMQDRASEVRA